MLRKIILLCLLLVSVDASAATISNKQSWVTNYTASTSPVTTYLGGGSSGGLNPAAGNLVVATLEIDTRATFSSISDNFGDTGGTSWAQVGPIASINNASIYLFWRQVGGGGSITGNQVSASFTGAYSADLQLAEYQPSAAATFSVDGTTVTQSNNVSANPVVGSITTTQAGLVISYLNTNTGGTTAGSGFTLYSNTIPSLLNKPALEYDITSASGSVSVAWVQATSASWSGIGIAFKATSTGGGSSIATINGLAKASIGTVNGLAIGSVSGVDGLP